MVSAVRRWLLTLLVLTGCGRWLGTSVARHDIVAEELRARRFPMTAPQAAQRFGSDRVRCDVPEPSRTCSGCVRGLCFQLLEDPTGTRVEAPESMSEEQLMDLWQPLDAESLTTLRQELPARAELRLDEEDARFEPRFGITGGVTASLFGAAGSGVGFGARLGLRRWFTSQMIAHVAFEYQLRVAHELSLRVGFELTRWTNGRLWGSLGAPSASLSFFVGPVVDLVAPGTRVLGTVPQGLGVRTGVGVHITQISSAPFFFEIAAETRFLGEASTVSPIFTLGVGL